MESEPGKGSTFWFTIPFKITKKLNEEKQLRREKMLSGTIFPAKAHVLVAEDHPMNQLFITKLLKRFGIGTFEIVQNGAEAFKRYCEKPWDIILMDCHMPEKNGYDTTKEIRVLEKTTGKHTPIVAMTANAMVGDKEKCLRYGMDEYLSKPISIDELKEVMGQWIHFEDLAGTKTTDQTGPTPLGRPAPVDLSQLREFSEGDKETEMELIRAFAAQSDKNLKTLAENHAGENAIAWQEAGHMFKGGAAGMGAHALSQLCMEAQHFNGTPQERAALFEKISAEYARVKDYLTKTGLLG